VRFGQAGAQVVAVVVVLLLLLLLRRRDRTIGRSRGGREEERKREESDTDLLPMLNESHWNGEKRMTGIVEGNGAVKDGIKQ
jgi:hypothetical protein